MKKSSMLLFVAALVLSSCGTATQFASSDNEQKFRDGIYNSSPSFKSKTEKAEDQAVTDALIEKTKASEIYLLGEKKDTIMIPDNFSARIQYDQKLGGTVITVGENPYDWRFDLENNYGYYYGPYSVGSSWYWSRHYNPWYWDAWSYHSPWRFNRWHYHSSWYYDPWYFGGWYDPWYYGSSWGFYDPWYYGGWYGGWNPYYPYYAGWYGCIGWYPHHHHHHHHHPGHISGGPSDKNHYRGQRYQTGSERLASGSGSAIRGGAGVRSSVSRSTSTAASSPTTGRATSSSSVSRTTTNRTTATKVNSTSGNTSKGSAVKPAGGTTVTRSAPPAYRKPSTGSTSGSSSVSSSTASQPTKSGQSYRSSTSQTRSSSSTSNRSYESSSYQRSSSSYNRSSTPSSSGSSYNRGGSSVGGSVSRGGTSSGYRR